ncbi:glycosyltransferase family 2 protein, partial [archaeon]
METVALVPTYNEEKNIGEVIRRLKKVRGVKIVVI